MIIRIRRHPTESHWISVFVGWCNNACDACLQERAGGTNHHQRPKSKSKTEADLVTPITRVWYITKDYFPGMSSPGPCFGAGDLPDIESLSGGNEFAANRNDEIGAALRQSRNGRLIPKHIGPEAWVTWGPLAAGRERVRAREQAWPVIAAGAGQCTVHRAPAGTEKGTKHTLLYTRPRHDPKNGQKDGAWNTSGRTETELSLLSQVSTPLSC
ncbi:hypothetical protein B0T20DRAFT_388824 [Sordaria brevicollis]|uniref:Uncharacterized protein n=1 Tax=Sordaria brevicollis TaxID=83679 RepID=A0AAE0PNK9_SORBR|nr:hypothetical protein B0T20DRAFT_388824 [Sordaria brevicollis]